MKAWALAAMVGLVVGCGGSDKKEAEEPVAEETSEEPAEETEEWICPQEKMDAINAYLERQRKYMARCWADALEAKEVPATANGSITLSFTIKQDGTAGNIEVTQVSHKSQTLESCVLHKAERWKMETLEQPLPFSYRFGFQRL